MSEKTTLNIVVHVNDETVMGANRVPSSVEDFVSVKIGPEVSVLLFNPAQAKKIIQVAMDAHRILRTIETDIEEAEMACTLDENEDYNYEGADLLYDDGVDCTIANPCYACQDSY